MSAPAGEDTPAAGDDVEPAARSRSPRPSRWVFGAVAALVLVAGIATAIIVTRPQPTYDDATQQRFVDACVADGGEPVRPACTCLYGAITEQIPYDRFVEVDEELSAAREAGEKIVLPDDIAALVPDCQIPA